MSEGLERLGSGEADLITLHDGRIMRTHGPAICEGEACCIHNPSNHPLNTAPLDWRDGPFDLRPPVMERRCPHNIGHPDPDALAFRRRTNPDDDGSHGCDGCCADRMEVVP